MNAARVIFACAGGEVLLPALGEALADRGDGGNLIVNPPRPVWERCVLDANELDAWGRLVAATGEAMLAALPQLEGGCINYWEAGNWALNDAAEPVGRKSAPEARQVHMHLIGRSRSASSPDLAWGEAPRFPSFADRGRWASQHALLTPAECSRIVEAMDGILRGKFAVAARQRYSPCQICDYPEVTGWRHGCAHE